MGRHLQKLALMWSKAFLGLFLLLIAAAVLMTEARISALPIILIIYAVFSPAIWRGFAALGRAVAQDEVPGREPVCIPVFLAGAWRIKQGSGGGAVWGATSLTARLVDHAMRVHDHFAGEIPAYFLGTEGELEAVRAILSSLPNAPKAEYRQVSNTDESVMAVIKDLSDLRGPETGREGVCIVAAPTHLLRCAMLFRSYNVPVAFERTEKPPVFLPNFRLFIPTDEAPQRTAQVIREAIAIIGYIAQGKIRKRNFYGLLSPGGEERSK